MASEWLFPTETSHEENIPKSKHEDLFVFGYACKLFRDDEQAKAVDKGKYMIPWMGDERIKIDRYDGRGHLYDLKPYDADFVKEPVELGEEEKQLEALCDEERYLELHTDLAEKSMYEEEEWKRYYESLAEGYKAVGFSYDGQGQQQHYSQETESPDKAQDPSEQPYEPPASLQVPQGMQIPSTVKEQAIIEKTAKFIAEHGVQMEIMMKTKQANNPQFLFMHFENILHPFYKHMVKMIKAKKYIPVTETKKEENLNDSGETEEGLHGYLHPVLMTNSRASPTPEVYKPIQMPKVSIHETSYGQLLQSLSKVNKTHEEKRNKKIKQEVKTEPQDPTSGSQYSSSMPPPPGIEPVTLPKSTDDTSGSVEVKQESQNDSEDDSTHPMPQIVPPPPDAQPVVDRMAMYVAKNGEEFEQVVKSKNDQRFQFLEPWHVHYGYYLFKKQLFIQEMERERKEKEDEEKRLEREKAEKLAKGVKFKLKKAREQEGTASLGKKVVFDNDESSDDEQTGDSIKERKNKSDRSGTSTPVTDSDPAPPVIDTKNNEMLEKRLAEQRVKDRLAASAREKLSQADKEKQIKLERKKKAAMFINLLKTKAPSIEADTDSKTDSNQPTPSNSNRSSPVKEDSRSHHKSKHKSRDRDRSKDRRSRDRRSKSRSRSSSRSKSKKKKRRRSITPPSAYATTKRSPLRLPPPPAPSRYGDIRPHYSRSPSQSKRQRRPSRSRSRSPSRSKSKKKKRSRSPKNKGEDSSHKKSSSKKKKKRSRSRSRSKDNKKSIQEQTPSEESQSAAVTSPGNIEARAVSPEASEAALAYSEAIRLSKVVEELEEGETKDSSPEPGEIEDTSQSEDNLFKFSTATPNMDRTPSSSQQPSEPQPNHSPYSSPTSASVSSRSPSPSKPFTAGPHSRSNSRSPYHGNSTPTSHVTVGDSQDAISREGTPAGLDRVQNGSGDEPNKSVSNYMLSRVREIIKASKQAIKEEEALENS